jgi:hypothetical protein
MQPMSHDFDPLCLDCICSTISLHALDKLVSCRVVDLLMQASSIDIPLICTSFTRLLLFDEGKI